MTLRNYRSHWPPGPCTRRGTRPSRRFAEAEPIRAGKPRGVGETILVGSIGHRRAARWFRAYSVQAYRSQGGNRRGVAEGLEPGEPSSLPCR
jgi:hypothetical protein